MILPDETLDLRGVPCPANAARAVLRLAGMDPGAHLELLLDDGEPVANVCASLDLEGHTVAARERQDGGWRLIVRCA